jgi:hypothetical protein
MALIRRFRRIDTHEECSGREQDWRYKSYFLSFFLLLFGGGSDTSRLNFLFLVVESTKNVLAEESTAKDRKLQDGMNFVIAFHLRMFCLPFNFRVNPKAAINSP